MGVFDGGRSGVAALVLAAGAGLAGCHTVQTAPSSYQVDLGVVERAEARERIVLGDDGAIDRVPVDGKGKRSGPPVSGKEDTWMEERHVGIQLLDLPPDLADALHGRTSSVVVGGCTLGGPAHRAGIRRGDRLVSVDGTVPESAAAAVDRLAALEDGDVVALSFTGPLGDLEVQVTAQEDITREFEMRIPLVLHAEKGVRATDFDLIGGGLLLHREAEFWPSATRAPAHHATFGVLLNLFRVETSPAETEIRIAWIIPIRW